MRVQEAEEDKVKNQRTTCARLARIEGKVDKLVKKDREAHHMMDAMAKYIRRKGK